jgi:hypothetical protein
MYDTHPHRTLAARFSEERGNCFLYGCVTLVILGLLGGLIAFLVTRNFVSEVRDKFTEAAPIALPTVDMPAGQIQSLIARVDDYARDLRAGKPLPALTLSEAEVNALLQNHPDLKHIYGGLLYVTLEEGRVTGNMSTPLDWLPGLGGRYFNGSATFDISLKDHNVDIFLRSASVKGEKVPEQYVAPVRQKDFAKNWERDRDARTLIEKIDSVKIEKGSVTVTPANKAEAVPAPPAENKASPGPA